MDFSLLYLFRQGFYRFIEFWIHWYRNGFSFVAYGVMRILRRFDQYFAMRITLRNFFEPLYRDYTAIGYILGFVLRSVRVLAASFFYALLIIGAAFLYLFWASIPLYVILKIIEGI
ncbi:MAG: hypothetical protein A2586_01520 [Candidatus Harrisonbacteria bacterium RIFOXYD1_FULL_40_9]|uniref:Uncharacterized protein n=1 Tax=Candidatus Harrisonbacteria bacterium RIFOXYD1_FULL_40_9 TaxID=1798412 RepID=A0A1G1ZYT3_9BACT|nr:MAG: hypothetical protein A2586_01520 [Candidatus Harrisonbacteria bacterium RIFOXYD1_FULL_40_9]